MALDIAPAQQTQSVVRGVRGASSGVATPPADLPGRQNAGGESGAPFDVACAASMRACSAGASAWSAKASTANPTMWRRAAGRAVRGVGSVVRHPVTVMATA